MRNIYYLWMVLTFTIAQGQPFDHSIFDNLLGKYVSNGSVNYKGVIHDTEQLKLYLSNLQNVTQAEFET